LWTFSVYVTGVTVLVGATVGATLFEMLRIV